jgi:hypothetical protein
VVSGGGRFRQDGRVRAPAITVAWLCATAVAVGVSWFGVRTVVQDAVLPPPQLAVPMGVASSGVPPEPTAPPVSAATGTTTTTAPTTTTSPTAASTTAPTSTTSKTAATTTTTADGNVHRYSVKGGQVVLSMSDTSATLVSATPADGYAVQVWPEDGWLRVDFTSGDRTSTVIATWNGHPPSVQTYES